MAARFAPARRQESSSRFEARKAVPEDRPARSACVFADAFEEWVRFMGGNVWNITDQLLAGFTQTLNRFHSRLVLMWANGLVGSGGI
jgi:hypothetical protein